jgi:hypothetical protein
MEEREDPNGSVKTHLLLLVERRVERWPLVVAQFLWRLVNVLRRGEKPSFGDGLVLLRVGHRGVHGMVERLGCSSPMEEDAICVPRTRVSERARQG